MSEDRKQARAFIKALVDSAGRKEVEETVTLVWGFSSVRIGTTTYDVYTPHDRRLSPEEILSLKGVADLWIRAHKKEVDNARLIELLKTDGPRGRALAAILEAVTPKDPTPDHVGWTVILLYPDYMQEQGTDVYVGWSNKETWEAAVADMKWYVTNIMRGQVSDPDDFALIGVMEGRHEMHGKE